MTFVERLGYTLAGGFLAAAIAMAIVFWCSIENSRLVFQILIPLGMIGGFILGREFYDFLKKLFSDIW